MFLLSQIYNFNIKGYKPNEKFAVNKPRGPSKSTITYAFDSAKVASALEEDIVSRSSKEKRKRNSIASERQSKKIKNLESSKNNQNINVLLNEIFS